MSLSTRTKLPPSTVKPSLHGGTALPESTRLVSQCVRSTLDTPGRPLDSTVRRSLEQSFNYVLDSISIHAPLIGPVASHRADTSAEREADSVAARLSRRIEGTAKPTGVDFAAVRIHDGDDAVASAQVMGANAYTSGSHIVFARHFSPVDSVGKRLLAHELTHVVQQGAATLGGGPRASAYFACDQAYPREHERVLKAMDRIRRKYPMEGEDRLPSIKELATSVPPAHRPLLLKRLTKVSTTDAFAVYLKNNFPKTREAFFDVLRQPELPRASGAPKASKEITVPAPPSSATPEIAGAEVVRDEFSQIRNDPQYLDNFSNNINDAWLPNERMLVLEYPNGAVLRIALADLLRLLRIPTDLNPQPTEVELRRKYKIPDDLVLPESSSPTSFMTIGGRTLFYRDRESGVIYPTENVHQYHFPRIANSIKQIESVRVNEELWQEVSPKLLNAITAMEWSAPRGFGVLLVSLGRRVKGASRAVKNIIKPGAPKPPAGHAATPEPAVPKTPEHATPKLAAVDGTMGLPEANIVGKGAQRPVQRAALDGITPETTNMLNTNPDLKKALESAPRAAQALKKCRSLCFPKFTTPTQVDRLERMLKNAETAGVLYNEKRLTDFLRSKGDWKALEQGIDELEKDLLRKREVLGEFGEASKWSRADRVTPEGRPRTITLRAQPGTATGGEKLPDVTDQWFPEMRNVARQQPISGTTDPRVAQIPGQIARKLRGMGMSFKNFDEFRETFWKAVAADPVLGVGWTGINTGRMKGGLAPYAPSAQSMGGGSNAVYQINHKQAIKNAGEVYNMDNLEVVGPRFHSEIGD